MNRVNRMASGFVHSGVVSARLCTYHQHSARIGGASEKFREVGKRLVHAGLDTNDQAWQTGWLLEFMVAGSWLMVNG